MTDVKEVWVGQDVASLRLRLGLTISDLARRLSCTVEDVRSWESNTAIDPCYYNQLQGLFLIAENNSVAMAKRPIADSVMASNGLNQISEDELAELIEK